ncbi:MAG: hypothetical protein EXR49_03105 [Dehalococcoidia bacterium]|nr:hypothetical protein [Dehalococcoidia bacterium]
METTWGETEQLREMFTPLQWHFLQRLLHVQAVSKGCDTVPEADAWLRSAIDNVLYASLHDCIDAGLGEVAAAVMGLHVRPQAG